MTWGRRGRLIAFYFFLLAVPLALEHGPTWVREVRGSNDEKTPLDPLLSAGAWYQRVVSLGPRKPRRHFVRVVLLSKGVEPDRVFDNLCAQRDFTADLLHRIASAAPAAVVFDKYYSPNTCPEGDKGTRRLRGEILRHARRFPITIGRQTQTLKDLRYQNPDQATDAVARGLRPDHLLEMPSLFELRRSSMLTFGLTRVTADPRTIALQWLTVNVHDDPIKPEPKDSLALATVRGRDPEALPLIASVGKRSPYTGLLTTDQLAPLSAIDLLCKGRPQEWKDCARADSTILRDLAGRIVVIGEKHPNRDVHVTPVGEIPGVQLQASYIEALLDDRYLRSVPLPVELLLSILWFVGVELLLTHTKAVGRALVSLALINVGVAIVVYYFVVVNVGVYLSLLWPSTFAAVCRFLAEHLGRSHETSAQAQASDPATQGSASTTPATTQAPPAS